MAETLNLGEAHHSADIAPGPARGASILVVDDSSLNRKKMSKAVANLGHRVEAADDGDAALAALRQKPVDAVLLDIMMPGLDGFEVLRILKSDKDMRDIPVIVISALDEETESVVKAIELGAEDFLPKSFDPVLLKARLNASLTKKRYRDAEREYLRRVEQLTEAAEVVESGSFSPESLGLQHLAERDDALGRLAAVFRGMAAEIYEREYRLRRAVQTLQGSLLVIAVGVVWGLTPALSRMAAGLGASPLVLALWVNCVAALLCLSIAAYRGKLPQLGWRDLRFYVQWAIVAGILQRLTTLVVTGHVEAAMLSLVVTMQGFMVFAFAAATKLEKATSRRLLGLLVGLAGVAAVLVARLDGAGNGQAIWLGISLLLPLLFAVEGILVAARRPEHVDLFASVGLMMLLSAAMLGPFVYLSEGRLTFGPGIDRLELLAVLMGIVASGSVLLCFRLIATAGAVFASQSAYAMTIAGIIWGMLLLDEELSPVAWAAVLAILFGLYLVEPKANDDKIMLKRSFTLRPATQRRSAAVDGDR